MTVDDLIAHCRSARRVRRPSPRAPQREGRGRHVQRRDRRPRRQDADDLPDRLTHSFWRRRRLMVPTPSHGMRRSVAMCVSDAGKRSGIGPHSPHMSARSRSMTSAHSALLAWQRPGIRRRARLRIRGRRYDPAGHAPGGPLRGDLLFGLPDRRRGSPTRPRSFAPFGPVRLAWRPGASSSARSDVARLEHEVLSHESLAVRQAVLAGVDDHEPRMRHRRGQCSGIDVRRHRGKGSNDDVWSVDAEDALRVLLVGSRRLEHADGASVRGREGDELLDLRRARRCGGR